ncbi:uncharacterized protein EAF01_003060 [Botrytis porri]|uniref:uncharacterized protein n=1 Tax=Botrytis porri TaxID=87229 RepID=UPI0018FFA19A|nr:uncharacterized protein EAF01_003060 [Botrytis porri]KAF7909342.1 hypothetical protein EAF01_003060 [Botrytis porri]
MPSRINLHKRLITSKFLEEKAIGDQGQKFPNISKGGARAETTARGWFCYMQPQSPLSEQMSNYGHRQFDSITILSSKLNAYQ